MDPYWKINKDFQIKKGINNANVYEKLVRQCNILKYLCQVDDLYCADCENVATIDKLYQAWVDDMEMEAKEEQENEEKEKKKEEDGKNDEKENKNENEKDKTKERNWL